MIWPDHSTKILKKFLIVLLFLIAALIFGVGYLLGQEATYPYPIHCQGIRALTLTLDVYHEVLVESRDAEYAGRVYGYFSEYSGCEELGTVDMIAHGDRIPVHGVDELDRETNEFEAVRWRGQPIYCLVTDYDESDPCTYTTQAMLREVDE